MRFIYAILLYLLPFISDAQITSIELEAGAYQIDTSLNIAVARLEALSSYTNLADDVKLSLGTSIFTFKNTPSSLSTEAAYVIQNDMHQFTLYFTSLPIVNIEINSDIIDEEKRHATFTYSDDKQTITSTIGIELRGGFSINYPKKTYDIEAWTDATGQENKDIQLGELRSDDDWVLDAMYNEPLRLRSYTAHKLWLDIHQSYYLAEEPLAKAGADVAYVELFLNGNYKGLYLLSEQVDKKLLQIKSYQDNTIRGELFKGVSWGASTFGTLPAMDNNVRNWGGYELKYPKANQATEWGNIYDFTDFVLNANDGDFEERIWDHFQKDNFIDYYIFLNLINATDNTGKNIYVARYDESAPYFYTPWDLDGCLGTIWDGSYRNVTDNILTNGLYDRVLTQSSTIANQMNARWSNLRSDIICSTAISRNVLNTYTYLKQNNIYERERLVFPNYPFGEDAMRYTRDWLQARVAFLDDHFEYEAPIQDEANLLTTYIYPNPTSQTIYINNCNQFDDSTYRLFNSQGQLMGSGQFDLSLGVAHLPKGMYYLEMEVVTMRFVVE